jgi:hypothetical protein
VEVRVMGYASYKVTLSVNGGNPATGAEIITSNRNAILGTSKYLKGTTGPDGSYEWKTLATGFNNDTYDFNATFIGDDVEYVAIWSDRVVPLGNYEKNIVMRELYLNEIKEMKIPDQIINIIKESEGGESTLAAIREFNICMKQKLPLAALNCSTYVLEGLIKILAQRKNAWKEEFENATFGELINKDSIKKLLKKRLYDKMSGLNKFRIAAAHNLGVKSLIEEATMGMELPNEFMKQISRTFDDALTK